MTIIKADFQGKKQRDATSSKKTEKIPGFQLRIELSYSSPPIWRTVNLPGTLTLSAFHRVIQACFGWDDTASHRFLIGKIFYGPTKTDLSRVTRSEDTIQLYELENDMGFIFSYLYDGGCGWECEIDLEQLLPDSRDIPHPELVASDRATPPEQIDDIHEFQDILAQLESDEEDSAGILTQYHLPSSFNPAICDMDAINELIQRIK